MPKPDEITYVITSGDDTYRVHDFLICAGFNAHNQDHRTVVLDPAVNPSWEFSPSLLRLLTYVFRQVGNNVTIRVHHKI